MKYSTSFTIAGSLTISYIAWRGIGGFLYDLENIPSFPSLNRAKVILDTKEAVLSSACYYATLIEHTKQPNIWGVASLIYQANRNQGYQSTISMIDNIAERISGYKVASTLVENTKLVTDPIKETLNNNLSNDTLDVLQQVSLIGIGIFLSTMTNSIIPLYLSLRDNNVASNDEVLDSIVIGIVSGYQTTAGEGIYNNLDKLKFSIIDVGIKTLEHIIPEHNTINYVLPLIHGQAELLPVSLTWHSTNFANNQLLSGAVKLYLMFSNSAKLLSNSITNNANLLSPPDGGEHLSKFIPNNNELIWPPLATVFFDILGGDLRNKFGDNPVAVAFIRDIVKAVPIVILWYQGAEIGNSGIHYSLGSVSAGFAKPLCKLSVIGMLSEGFDATLESSGRIGNFICEPLSMMLNLAAKGLQQKSFEVAVRFNDSEPFYITMLEDKLVYFAKNKESPTELVNSDENNQAIINRISNKLKVVLESNNTSIKLSHAEITYVWHVVGSHNDQVNHHGLLEYINENIYNLINRGFVVGSMKTIASDQLGQSLSGFIKFMHSNLPEKPSIIFDLHNLKIFTNYFLFDMGKEVITTLAMATPTRIVVELIDYNTKKINNYFSDDKLYQTNLIEEVTSYLEDTKKFFTTQLEFIENFVSYEVDSAVESIVEDDNEGLAIENIGENAIHNEL